MVDALIKGKPDPMKALKDFSDLLQHTVKPAHAARMKAISESEDAFWKTCVQGKVEPHQVTGIQWLSAMYDCGCSCILGDEMGLGKTGQTVLTILRLRQMGVMGPILIVCPLAVLEHWKEEFSKFAKMVGITAPPKVIIYHNTHAKKGKSEVDDSLSKVAQMLRGALLQEFLESSGSENGWPVLVTTYDTLKGDDYNVLRSIPEKRGSSWAYVVVDEAHNMKNDQTRIHNCILELRPYAYLLLTGTVINNNVDMELVNLLRYVFPPQMQGFDLTGHVNTFRNRKIQWDMGKPVSDALIYLRDILYVFMLRRTFESATAPKRMPLRRRITIYVEQTPLQKAVYAALKTPAIVKVPSDAPMAALPEPVVAIHTRAWCRYERMCDMHPFVLPQFFDHDALSYQPAHSTPLELARLQVEVAAASHKVTVLLNILANLYTTGHRVLIFSQRMPIIAMLALIMRRMQYPFDIITGATSDRMERMNRFNSPSHKRIVPHPDSARSLDEATDETIMAAMQATEFWAQLQPPSGKPHPNCKHSFVMLLSTKAVATGVNLEGADTVVFFDQCDNPQLDNQAEARAYRQTQVKPVEVIRLMTAAAEQEYIEGAVYDKRRLQTWFEFDSVLELENNPQPPISVSKEIISLSPGNAIQAVLCDRQSWTRESCRIEQRYAWTCQGIMPAVESPYIRELLRARIVAGG